MPGSGENEKIQPGDLMIKKFKSIQSVIFAVLSVLLLGAVIIMTVISLSYTRQSVFENSSLYTQTIIQQMNQNIDSYIDYMENTSYLVSSNEDVQKYLLGTLRILRQEIAFSVSLRQFWTAAVIF